MRPRIMKFGGTLVAIAALAVGGSAIASGGQNSPAAKPAVVHVKKAAVKTAHVKKTMHVSKLAAASTADPAGPDNSATDTGTESTTETPEASSEAASTESDTDAAAQAAACAAVDPTGTGNVQYDGTTCTLDTGADNNSTN
jgi:hypothetical protein